MKKILLIAAIVGAALAGCSKNEGGEPTIKGIVMTTTAEGNIEIYISGIGEATIDWGDGTPSETLTLSNPTDLGDVYDNDFPHSYAAAGKKTITITGSITALVTGWTEAVSALNISGVPELKYLDCCDEDLKSLDLSKNTALEYLDCGSNQLTSLDLSKNTALEYLNCGDNQLTSLDLSKNTALEELYCNYCELTSLDLSKNTALRVLQCFNNQLTALDLSKNAVLGWLVCRDNPLFDLDLNNNSPNLSDIDCSNTDLNLTALIDIFNALPDRTGTYGNFIRLTNTPGASASGYSAASAVAIAKNWNVIP
ncbi:MAG: leucine-rich repeat domain-containing protein [Bacteroidales bacterium]|nr:leucine-rich repeat domain-containing protein [Bacteroidales bacterium]